MRELLAENVARNPLFQKYRCMLEQDHPVHGYPAVSGSLLQGFLADHQQRGPMFGDIEDPNEGTLGLALDSVPRNLQLTTDNPTYNLGALHLRADGGLEERDLYVRPDGIQVSTVMFSL